MSERDANSATVVVEPPPRMDAMDRYERMLDVQIDVLDGIDDKAAHLTRLIGVLLGIMLTAASLVPEFEAVSLTGESAPTVVTAAIGVSALLVALGFAVLTYLSSNFEYGASVEIARHFASANLEADDYSSVMLHAYADIIVRNRRVVVVNSRRFRNALASLFVGLVAVSLAALLALAESPLWLDWLGLAGAAVATIALLRYLLGEAYLTLQRETRIHERG